MKSVSLVSCAKPMVCVLSALFLATFFVPSLVSCKKTDPAEQERLARERDDAAKQKAVSDFVAALSDEQRISQLFLVNIEGDAEFSPVEKTGALFGRNDEGDALVPGGCLLFSYNISDSPEKIRAYTDSIRRFYAENNFVPPYIAIDQEGGYVNRLRGITSNLVSQKKVTEWFSAERAHDLYAAQARQLRELGIQMNLAPVVEVETDSNRDFLGTRTFGTLEQVLSYGKAVVSAYEENGIAVVLKHFPGNNNTDPHSGLPQIDLSSQDMFTLTEPFSHLAPLSSALLMSHIIARITPAPEESSSSAVSLSEKTQIPACFSPFWIHSARSLLCSADSSWNNSAKLIFSDDIFMGALSDNGYPPEVAVVSAIDAGVDCIMLSEKTFGSVAGVLLAKSAETETLSDDERAAAKRLAQKINESVCRVIAYKIKAGLLQFVPVLNEKGETNPMNPAYIVSAAPDFPPFDKAAFQSAYDDGMEFYK